MDVLITYDINIRHSEVKTELKKKGFKDNWKSNEIIYYLPNTTLWYPKLDKITNAQKIFDDVLDSLNEGQPETNKIKVDRFMSVPAYPWSGIPGKPHS